MEKLIEYIICGSRNISDRTDIFRTLDSLLPGPSLIISGGARGVDTLAIEWADVRDVPYEIYPAKWHIYGKSAGYRRNVEMLDAHPTAIVIAFWDGKSPGTKHMIETAKARGHRVIVERMD